MCSKFINESIIIILFTNILWVSGQRFKRFFKFMTQTRWGSMIVSWHLKQITSSCSLSYSPLVWFNFLFNIMEFRVGSKLSIYTTIEKALFDINMLFDFVLVLGNVFHEKSAYFWTALICFFDINFFWIPSWTTCTVDLRPIKTKDIILSETLIMLSHRVSLVDVVAFGNVIDVLVEVFWITIITNTLFSWFDIRALWSKVW